nr:uncharacterized protein LOC109779178 [Aegilops tauschii subsp. strangulata]
MESGEGDGAGATAAATTAEERAKILKRNSDDMGWAYGQLVDPNNLQRVMCNFCSQIFTGGIYRLKQHIAANSNAVRTCLRCPQEAKEACLKAFEEKASKKQKKYEHEKVVRDAVVIDASSTPQGQARDDDELTCIGSSQPHVLGPIDKWTRTIDPKLSGEARLKQMKINKAAWEERSLRAHEYIARWVYTHAIPFNAIGNDEFRQMVHAIGQFGADLDPPSQYDLRETLLKSEYARTKSELKDREVEKGKHGCSLMTDAWTDMKRRSIMNLVTHCSKGVSFIKSKETSDTPHTSEMIFNLVDKTIEELGVEHVVQVVTDNASNNMGAKDLLKVKRPKIFWSSCATHTVNLMLQGIGNLAKFKKIIDQAKAFTIFVYGHHRTLECMRSFTKKREIIRPGVTRFASQFLTLQSLADKADSLRKMVGSSKWDKIKDVHSKKGKDATAIILNKPFWKGVNLCIKVFEPLVKVLRLVDGDARPSMGFVYGEIVKAKKEIKEAFGNIEARYKDVLAIVEKKMKDRLDAPLQLTAYLLNPHYSYADDSIFDYIHTKRRNRLTTDRLNQLVYIQFNSRLLSKKRKIKQRKNIDVLLTTDASEAQGFLFEGGDDHAFMVFPDGDEGADGIPWSVVGDAMGTSEQLELRRSARVRDLHDEEFESDEEEVEETDSEEEDIEYGDDEDEVVTGRTYVDAD